MSVEQDLLSRECRDYVDRMNPDRIAEWINDCKPQTKRTPGWPCKRWMETLKSISQEIWIVILPGHRSIKKEKKNSCQSVSVLVLQLISHIMCRYEHYNRICRYLEAIFFIFNSSLNVFVRRRVCESLKYTLYVK